MNPLVAGDLLRSEMLLTTASIHLRIMQQQHNEVVGILREVNPEYQSLCLEFGHGLVQLCNAVQAHLEVATERNTDQIAENTQAIKQLTRALMGNLAR